MQNGQDSPHTDPFTWNIIRDYVTTDMTLPSVIDHLQNHFGSNYRYADWASAFQAIDAAEGDISQAQDVIEKLTAASRY